MVIILKDIDIRTIKNLPTYRIKIDPGAKHTGIAIVCNETNEVMFFMQLEHRGANVKDNLKTRHDIRRNRRNRETRYRRCKFPKGTAPTNRSDGWLPPSLMSIGNNIINLVKKLKKYINITECSFEAVRFDSQLMDNPDIEGTDYQHGTLSGYEIREYLMEHYRHTCQYCGGASDNPILEWEHKIPRSKGGSDSVKNATLSFRCCNQDKGSNTLEEWLTVLKSKRSTKLNDIRIDHITKILSHNTIFGSNRYSAWANSLRRYEESELFKLFDTVECSSGGKTKYNREQINLPKDHHYDALCVGTIPDGGYNDRTNGYVLHIKAIGRGTRLRGQVNQCGVITVKYKKSPKKVFGFQTGDIVIANIPKGKYHGIYAGRVLVRSSGYFDIKINGKRINTSYKNCNVHQNFDGYEYRYCVT